MTKKEILVELENFMKSKILPNLTGYGYYRWSTHTNLQTIKSLRSEEWIIGVEKGENCWSKSNQHTLPEEPNEIILLDEFLEQYMPNINLLQYKKLIRLIKYQVWTNNEFYGNSCKYKSAYITFEDIAETLSKMEHTLK